MRIVISGTDWLGASIGYEGIPSPTRSFSFGDHRPTITYDAVRLAGAVLPFSILSSDTPRLQSVARGPLAAAASGVNVRVYKVIALC